MGYDHGDSFPFNFEPNGLHLVQMNFETNGLRMVQNRKENCHHDHGDIQYERKWNTSFLSAQAVDVRSRKSDKT